ncbi:ABC transporter substrate-binding protein [Paenibacillus macquariensis]|uniref:Aldouronate transport system substrate-binding protein n=1 Tax=Paenibacillus macquariensis TaxID=948756 RepID=A0ABY1K9S4_9BACL|nr:ABC transporter substrate-binding protein [Paenibacillus macquariensis]MEC0092412.1 ABC transporter substrate-binding protein [Paenibacillus macquariensis]OAB35381.1 ABC transporter substrate-binding protein [Paenibacillus macquariensis subsp. macquariensis]SIR47683.1 putative aldouronate transport system substrate-binding protein [Paenibacillus macquariensis]
MRKNKYFVKTILMVALAFTMLISACSNGGTNSANSETEGAASKDQGGNDSGTLKPVELVMVYPVGGEPKDMKLVQDEINKMTKEKINATVKLVPIGFGAWAQQKTLMLSGNEQVDLIVSGMGTYSQDVAKGQFLELDGNLAEQGKGITEALDSLDPAFLNATRIGGKIYAVPSIRDLAADYGITMRKDLVDKYNIDTTAIKSLDDLDVVFKTIKDNEPGIIPTVKYGTSIIDLYVNSFFDNLGEGFGVLPGYDNDLKVVNMYETPEYADMLNTVRRWYQAGYVAKDAATSTETQYNLVKSGKAFSFISHMKPGIATQESRSTSKEMVSVHFRPAVTATSAIISIMWSVARTSKDPERAMMLLNLMYTDKDFINLLDFGIEGKHYVKVSDNIIDFPQGVDATNSGYNLQMGWMFGNQSLSYIWNGDDPNLWTQLAEFNKGALKSKALGFTFNADAVKTEIAAVTNVQNQYKIALETGTIDPVSKLPEFNKQLKSAGLDKIIAEKQKQLDAWAEANKK